MPARDGREEESELESVVEGVHRAVGLLDVGEDHLPVFGVEALGLRHVDLSDDGAPVLERHPDQVQRVEAVVRHRLAPLEQAPPARGRAAELHVHHHDGPRVGRPDGRLERGHVLLVHGEARLGVLVDREAVDPNQRLHRGVAKEPFHGGDEFCKRAAPGVGDEVGGHPDIRRVHEFRAVGEAAIARHELDPLVHHIARGQVRELGHALDLPRGDGGLDQAGDVEQAAQRDAPLGGLGKGACPSGRGRSSPPLGQLGARRAHRRGGGSGGRPLGSEAPVHEL
mmetsp:Transcript_10232/g.23649  ORF Transcript_10232/g.23649 Transcript_10232/m.23649 type:complete len:282 (-) Transcript_10232:586-1431(-)